MFQVGYELPPFGSLATHETKPSLAAKRLDRQCPIGGVLTEFSALSY